ncbi:hypothetical protein PMAYCL1PPCAC_06494, partial [Pristionchus mayeri]
SAIKKKPSGNGPARSHVAVAIRVRPPNAAEAKDTVIVKADAADRSITVRTKTFSNFDRVYGCNSRQQDIYKDLVKKQVEDVLRGYNCTIFAYGQTGTGKTYTMEGGEGSIEGDWETDESTGIIPRAAQHVFTELSAKTNIEYIVRLSYVEIYNEEMIDLLGTAHDEKHLIRLYEDPVKKGAIVVSGVEEIPVRCRDDVYRLLKQGTEQRRTAETLMNKRSSRSHSVLTISVLIRESLPTGEELVKQGKLRLVDLAGSENIGRSGAEGKRAKEAGNINTSLLALGRVINALTTNAPHVPYRESKLTRMLQDSLGGSSITTIIATLSPTNSNFEESVSTLEYAHRAMNIKNKPEVNENVNKKDLFKEYSGQIERLMRELKAAREKNGVYLDQELYDEMGKKIETSEEKIACLEQQLENTLELLKKHLADIELMDDLYGKAYLRVRTLEERLALRVDELEEAKLTIAKETQAHEETRRALDRCRAHADHAFSVAEDTKRQGWDAHHELMRLHPRCDAIVEIAEENRKIGIELAESMDKMVDPMRIANKQRMRDGEAMVEVAEKALGTLNGAVMEQLPSTTTSIEDATAILKSMVTRLSSLDTDHMSSVHEETALLVDMIKKGQLSISSTIHSVVDCLMKTSEEAKKRMEEMEKRNEEMKKEMHELRSGITEAIESGKKKREEVNEEMEKKGKEMMDMMNSMMSSMSSLAASSEERQREYEQKMEEGVKKMGEVEQRWAEETGASCSGLTKMVKEANEKTEMEISSCLPTLVSMGEKSEEYGKKTGEEREEWKRQKETTIGESHQQHDLRLRSGMASIDSLRETHETTQMETRTALDYTKSVMVDSLKSVDEDLRKLNNIVAEEMESTREIPPKDIEQAYRDFSDNPCPPSQEELYAESEEEGEGEEGDNDENEGNLRFNQRSKLRRSRFRVRDSILVGGEKLESPARVVGMRQRIDEEGSEASFGRDRTNRRE